MSKQRFLGGLLGANPLRQNVVTPTYDHSWIDWASPDAGTGNFTSLSPNPGWVVSSGTDQFQRLEWDLSGKTGWAYIEVANEWLYHEFSLVSSYGPLGVTGSTAGQASANDFTLRASSASNLEVNPLGTTVASAIGGLSASGNDYIVGMVANLDDGRFWVFGAEGDGPQRWVTSGTSPSTVTSFDINDPTGTMSGGIGGLILGTYYGNPSGSGAKSLWINTGGNGALSGYTPTAGSNYSSDYWFEPPALASTTGTFTDPAITGSVETAETFFVNGETGDFTITGNDIAHNTASVADILYGDTTGYTGKYYFEAYCPSGHARAGFLTSSVTNFSDFLGNSAGGFAVNANGSQYNLLEEGTTTQIGTGTLDGGNCHAVYGFAVDFDSDEVTLCFTDVFIDGTRYWVDGSKATSTSFPASATLTQAGVTDRIALHHFSNTLPEVYFNFGDDPTFGGTLPGTPTADSSSWYRDPPAAYSGKLGITVGSVDRATPNVGILSLDEAGPEDNGDRDLTPFNWGGIRGRDAVGAPASVPSLDLNFDGQASSFTRATTDPTANKANGDQLATDIVSCTRSTTATFMGSNGLIQTAAVNTPRVEFDASGNPLGLLVEESRTNYVLDSMDVSVGATNWTDAGGPTDVSGVTLTGPDGGAVQVVAADATSSYSRLEQTVNVTGDYIACSVYVAWPGTNPSDNIVLRVEGTNHSNSADFTTFTETVTQYQLDRSNKTSFYRGGRGHALDPTVEDVGNGWYRVSFVARTNGGTVSKITVYPFFAGNSNRAAFWGAQVEVGKAPTSFIATTSASATRAADDISLATSAFGYNTAAGTTVADFTMQAANSAFQIVYRFSDGTSSNRELVYLDGPSGDLYAASSESATHSFWTIESSPSFPLNRTVAFRHDGTSAQTAMDGTLGTAQTLNAAPATLRTTLQLGLQTGYHMTGHIRRFTYWPRAISNDQLAAYSGDPDFAGEGLENTGIISLSEALQAKYLP